MNKFDINRHRVIGIAKVHEQYSNAGIYILGYEDDNHHFVGFTEMEAIEIFKPRGKVFAKNFAEKNSHRANTLISISVEVDLNYDEENKLDKYRLSSRPRDYAQPVPYLNDNDFSLTDNNHNSVIKAFLNVSDVFIKSKERLYKRYNSHKDTGILCYWVTNEMFESRHKNVICSRKKLTYIIREDKIQPEDGYVDIFSDNEIILYVIDLIEELQLSLDAIDNLPTFAKKIDAPEEVLVSRLNRFKSILSMYSFTHNQIMQIASNPLMIDALQRSIKEYEDEYIQMYELRNRDKIKKLESENEGIIKGREIELQRLEREQHSLVSEIEKIIKQKEQQRDQIIAQIKKRTKEADAIEVRFETINEQKGRLIEDFSVIRDVIGEGSTTNNKPQRLFTRAIENHNSQGSEITTREEFVRILAAHLQNSELTRSIAENIFKLIVGRNDYEINLGVILFPSVKVIKPLLRAIGQYNLLSISVAPNWLSYEDLYNNGLADIIDSAVADSDRIHILLLQNMNLSYIPLYMQPINDCLYGLSNTLPTSNGGVEYPSNLLIFGTRTKQEAISVSEEDVELYGCVENTDYYEEYEEDIEVKEGFISMSFIEQYREDLYSYSSSPESYVD